MKFVRSCAVGVLKATLLQLEKVFGIKLLGAAQLNGTAFAASVKQTIASLNMMTFTLSVIISLKAIIMVPLSIANINICKSFITHFCDSFHHVSY